MSLPIKYNANWVLLCQKKQAQIDKCINSKNKRRLEYDYKVGENIMLWKYSKIQIGNPI